MSKVDESNLLLEIESINDYYYTEFFSKNIIVPLLGIIVLLQPIINLFVEVSIMALQFSLES